MNMKKIKTLNKLKIFDIYKKKTKMEKLNQTYIDNLINKVITETLEEKADKLVSRIKKITPTDDEVEEMMSSEVTEEMETCEQCGSGLKEGETCEQCAKREMKERRMAKLKNAPTEFDYVAENEEDEISIEDDLSIMSRDNDLDPLDRANRFCNKDSEDYNEQSCKYHKKLEGQMNEKLYGGQRKLDKNRNGKIDSEDFKMLRKRKKSSTSTHDEKEMEEGNAFTAKLKETPKGGKFKLGGKEYIDKSNIDESEKFIQKATKKMENKGTEGKFRSWCKRNGLTSEEGEVTKKCIDKAMKSDNSDVVKMANFAKNIKGYSGSEHKKKSVKLKESELIDLIEKIVIQEQKSNIKQGSPRGFETYKKVHQKDGKENSEALKATAKKMKDYLKDGSKGDYETNPDIFPKGNGELSKMSKKAYIHSGAVQDYVDNFTAAALENLDYDGISPNEDWVTDNIEGSSRTGNNPEWANTGKSDVNKKRNKIRKDNMLAKLKRKAYNKAPQPAVLDKTGEDEGDKVISKLESIDPKKSKMISEEFERMKSLIGYNQKTQ
jgi:hypothetical protein